MDFQTLISRAQGILLKPKEEWSKIKAETTTISKIFTSYALILAAIPVVAHFIGYAISGFYWRGFFGRALISIILEYVLSLAVVYVLALAIKTVAPNFSSKADMLSAMKLAVYSWTPAWVAGILYIIPSYMSWLLVALISLYSIYLLYLGLDSPLLDTPKEKITGYLVVITVIVLVLFSLGKLIKDSIFYGPRIPF